MIQAPPVLLASTSRYRRELLGRLGVEFEVAAPGVDESPLPGEAPRARAARLAMAKARALSARHPQAAVIGSDQVAAQGETIFDKPGEPRIARAQLEQLSGREAQFHTAVAILCEARGFAATHLDTTRVVFRSLSGEEIARYVEREQPLDTAASMKSEALGIALLERIESIDPTALVGLPLIWVAATLRRLGVRVP
jgi:septum formation protein